MALIVQKYGGSSVKDPEHIKRVAQRVVKTKRQGHSVVVVVSALGDTTDLLLDLADDITLNPSDREMDMLLSTGEQVSISLLTMAIHELGEEAVSMTGYQVGILTDVSHTKARIVGIETKRLVRALRNYRIVIVAGFQGKTLDEEITTLGRGGSDLTAVALAAALKSKRCEIYTDVDGVFTTDPRIEKNARKMDSISYEEMLELASLGAQVMQSRSIEVADKFNVPIVVRNSKNNKPGTLITREDKAMEKVVVRGIALNTNEAKVTIFGVPDRPGVASTIFKVLAEGDINVDMIIQNKTTSKRTDISFTIMKKAMRKALPIIRKAAKKVGAKNVATDQNIAKLSVVGVGMRSHSGVAFKLFSALAEKKINIDMISTSEIKISLIIDNKYGPAAVRAVHKKFNLGKRNNKPQRTQR